MELFFGSTFVVMVASLSSKNAFIMYFRNFICAAMMDAYQWKWTNLNSNNLFSKLVSPQYSELNGIAFVYSQLYVAFLFIVVLFCFPPFCCLHVKMQTFVLELKVTGFGKRIKYIVCVFPMNNLNYDTPCWIEQCLKEDSLQWNCQNVQNILQSWCGGDRIVLLMPCSCV